jgi:hypothetical protein
MPKPVSQAMLPSAGPATPCDQQPRRWKSHLANGSSHFSGGKIVLQMGAVVFPAKKSLGPWEQPFFRRKSRSAHGSCHFADGKIASLMREVIFPAEKSPGKFSTHTQTCKTIFPAEE